MNNLSIKQKLFFVLAAEVLLFVVAANLIMHRFLNDIAEQEIVRGLKSSLVAYYRMEEQRRDRVVTQASSIAQTPHLQASLAITDVDSKTILYAGEAIKDIVDVPLILLLSGSGKLYADIVNRTIASEDLSTKPGVRSLIDGRHYYGIWRYKGKYFNVAMSPVLSGNQLVGGLVLGDTFNSQETLQLIKDVTGTQVLMLLDGQFTSDDRTDLALRKILSLPNTLSQLDDDPSKVSVEDENYYVVALPLRGANGVLFFYRAQSEISASFDTFRYLIFAASGITLLLGLIFSLWTALKVSRPLTCLTKVAEEYGRGNFKAEMNVTTNDEIGDLASAFKRLGKDLFRIRRSLEDSHDYVYNVIEAMSDTLMVINKDGSIDKVNGAALEVFCYTEEEIRKLSFVDLIESSELVLTSCKDLISDQAILSRSVNYKTRTGESIPMYFTASEMLDEMGLTKAIVCVARDRRPVEKLIKEMHDAEAASEAKSTFLARMSHELRTPLNAILGFSQIQRSFYSDGACEKQKENMDHIMRAGEHLLTLINDILDVVSLEQNHIEIPLKSTCLDSVIRESISLVSSQALSVGIKLEYLPTNIFVIANAHRLKQVLVNLLTNGIKFNVVAGAVTVKVKPVRESMVDIIIVDTGVGIAKEEQTLVFEPFTRLTYAEHHEIQGTGIGLALAKFLVQQMNGEIAIESKFGEGSSFHVLLQQGEHPDALQRDMLTSHVTRSLLPQARGGHTILYIEDNLSNRELFRGIVSNYPHIVLQTANTAEEGIEVADREIPGIIFVDINLPRMDGIDCFKALRSNPDLANSKIIAISADVLPEQIAIAVEAGFDDYITKPIDVDQINGILDSFTKMFDV